MSPWKSRLNSDASGWLLEESNPSVRYFTLRWLLDQPEDDPQVAAASRAISESAPVQKLLKAQKPEGYWGTDKRPHHGTRGYLLLLDFLGYRGNGGVRKAMDYRIEGCLQDDGAYGMIIKERIVELPCHGAHVLQLMLRYGYEDDPRTRGLLAWLLRVQDEKGFWPCISKAKCPPCLWATADVMRAYRDLPPDWVSPEVEESRHLAVEMFIESRLYQYGKGKPSPRWFEFGYPLQWDSDVLDVLELIAPFVDAEDERIQDGIALVMGKQGQDGKWPCEKHPKGGRWMQRFIEFEPLGQPSKWVTLHAMRMLKNLYSR